MGKKTIAVDLDDVLAENAEGFVKFSNERWHTNLRPEDFHEDLERLWGVDHDTVLARMLEYSQAEIVREYGHFAEALPVLKDLKQTYLLLLVTSRRKALIKPTSDWVEKYLPNIFSGIYHAGFFDNPIRQSHTLTKADILMELGANYLIDDQLKHCIAAAEAGIPALLFGEYAWNQTDTLPVGVTRVKDWLTVEEYFREQG